MFRSLAIAAGILLLAACSTTSTVHQAHRAPVDQVYAYAFSNQGGDDHEGIAQLDGVIQSHLRQAGLIDAGTANPKIEVVVKHYYVRSNGARFWAGIMAGATRSSATSASPAPTARRSATSTSRPLTPPPGAPPTA